VPQDLAHDHPIDVVAHVVNPQGKRGRDLRRHLGRRAVIGAHLQTLKHSAERAGGRASPGYDKSTAGSIAVLPGFAYSHCRWHESRKCLGNNRAFQVDWRTRKGNRNSKAMVSYGLLAYLGERPVGKGGPPMTTASGSGGSRLKNPASPAADRRAKIGPRRVGMS
jgi:hypothetical protein